MGITKEKGSDWWRKAHSPECIYLFIRYNLITFCSSPLASALIPFIRQNMHIRKEKKDTFREKKLLHIAITTLMSSFRFDCVPGGKNWMTICQMQRKTKPRHEFSMNRLFHNYVKSIPSSTNCLIQPGPTFRVDPTPCKTAHAVLAKAGISTSIIEIKVLSPASGLHMFINNKLRNK